jgi:hypothetical protein
MLYSEALHFLLIGILDVEYDLVQLPRGKLNLPFVCIFLIHGQAFITADIERFVSCIGP